MTGQEDPHGGVNPLAEITSEMVRIYKELFGRGPVRARTNWAGPDTLVCTLEETLTAPERHLVEAAQHERLRETRTFFQYASAPEFCEPVERLTGRRVKAFISGIDTKADGLSAEVFVLHPRSSGA